MDVKRVAPRVSTSLTAPGAQGSLFLNGDRFVGRIVGQPDGSGSLGQPRVNVKSACKISSA